MFEQLGRIRVRLLVVNLLVVLVPIAGLELARLHERQLLDALERDMRDQALLARAMIEEDLARGGRLDDERHEATLRRAARGTRTRIRLLDARGEVVVDSHRNGPPEGPEPPPPSIWPASVAGSAREISADVRSYAIRETWPAIPDRSEVRAALAGSPAAFTRIRARAPAVLLFLTEPIRHAGRVAGVVYVVRSTQPVLVELYRLRSGLYEVLGVTVVLTVLVTIVLALSISRPLARLSRAAKRIAAGERDVVVPVGGTGEVRELGESFKAMTEKLDARLGYISQFAADVAHEFKSPLTSIKGAAELLGEGAADDPEARERFLHNIALDVERLDRLVSRLLELSRIEASSEVMTTVDVEALLRRVASRAETPDVPVRVTWDAPSRFVRARAVDLETALLNLLDNAVRFSPAGEPVELEATAPRAGWLDIAVRDRGPGIPAADLPKIFDRFFTTDAERQGTGLGLAIVKTVVEAHGGVVKVEAREGAGTTFIVRIPARP